MFDEYCEQIFCFRNGNWTEVSCVSHSWAQRRFFSVCPWYVCVKNIHAGILPRAFQFFSLQVITNISMVIGPVAQFHENSKYYSAIPPKQNKIVDEALPHVTIQMPVYKESLKETM